MTEPWLQLIQQKMNISDEFSAKFLL